MTHGPMAMLLPASEADFAGCAHVGSSAVCCLRWFSRRSGSSEVGSKPRQRAESQENHHANLEGPKLVPFVFDSPVQRKYTIRARRQRHALRKLIGIGSSLGFFRPKRTSTWPHVCQLPKRTESCAETSCSNLSTWRRAQLHAVLAII